MKAAVERLVFRSVCAALLSACATTQRPDPIERFNRGVFAFNDTVDRAVVRPVAMAYTNAVPLFVQTGVRNVFANLQDAWSAVNLVLQGRPVDGFHSAMRVTANSTFGLLGVFDVATPAGIERSVEDFGQTLGVWGFGPGAFLVLPLLGPSTVRDSIGLSVDLWASPQNLVVTVPLRNSLSALRLVDARAGLLTFSSMLDDIALDKYLFVRDAYLQRRRHLVSHGDPSADDSSDAAVPVSPPAAGSAARTQ